MLDTVKEAEASIRRSDTAVGGSLRVALPPIASSPFLDLIADFAAAYPQVHLQTHLSTRHVDLRRDGYDVALRASRDLEPGLVARTLARFDFLAVASPAYLAAHGAPASLRDLRHHRCLMGFARGELPETHWSGGGRKIRLEGAFFSNSPAMLARAAERGLGIAVVPNLAVQGQLARGELVVVMPGVLRTEGRIAVVYPERELLPPAVRAFVDWLVARASAALGPPAAPRRERRSR